MTTSLLILAAGIGSRFGDAKQIVKVSARQVPLLFFSIADAVSAGVDNIVVVTRRDLIDIFRKEIFAYFSDVNVEFVVQKIDSFCPNNAVRIIKNRKKPWGTAHATLVAKNAISGKFLLINADDYYGKSAIKNTVAFLKNNATEGNLLSTWACTAYQLQKTLSPNGTVSRSLILPDENMFVKKFVEHHGIFVDHGRVVDTFGNILVESILTSMNLFALDDRIFTFLEQKFSQFIEENLKNDTLLSAEFGLPQNILAADIPVKILTTQDQWVGMTYHSDLEFVNNFLNTNVID